MVDQNALRFNQAMIVSLIGLAFVLNKPWLSALVAALMLIGTAWPGLAAFQLFYRRVLLPAGLLRPSPRQEDPAAPRFAQGLGGSFLLLAVVAFALGATTLGWALNLIVVALALINLLFDFCLGCFIYFQLERAGVLGKIRAAR